MSARPQRTPGEAATLVAYASRYGSTAEVAAAIGRTLGEAGHQVEVRHVDEVDDVADYGLVVVGSPIRYDRWMPDAAEFVRRHRGQLATSPTAFFFTCLAASQPGAAATQATDRYEQRICAIAPEVEPRAVGRFAGALDQARLPLVTRIVLRAVLAVRGADAGDHRDWGQITSWAQDLASADLAGASGRERAP